MNSTTLVTSGPGRVSCQDLAFAPTAIPSNYPWFLLRAIPDLSFLSPQVLSPVLNQ